MSTPTVNAMVAALKADPTIVGLVNQRVTHRDIRRTGWETAPSDYFDQDGVIRTSLMVDDNGDAPPTFGHPAEDSAVVYVWGFAPRTTAGRANLATLMERVKLLFYRWQVPATGAEARVTTRLGQQEDDSGALMDRLTLQISGVLAVSNF